MAAREEWKATGKRKTSIARVRIRPGAGVITVNKRTAGDYFMRQSLLMIIRQPMEHVEQVDKFDVDAKLCGGGLSGQAEALRHGISRALVVMDSEFRTTLKRGGFLTRDARKKERKKYGQPGARKRFQFSKR
ncbi:MAG: 30S ribosomal protein S9 [Deltaproteobacteria bacterium]|nr:30S ribosomal protein S9 [Deltaproteobacteria bacterium]